MKTIFINLLAFGTLFSSVLAITSKNPVISVVFVISTFVNAAGYLILLGVNFIGISYIIVYIGAIAVLFLFIIMMINIRLTDILETGTQYTKNLPLALAIGSLFIYTIFTIVPISYKDVSSLSGLLNILTDLNGFLLNTSSIVVNNNIFDSSFQYVPMVADTIFTNFSQIQSLGHGLYTYGAISLIICSIVLLLAMFSTIVISRNKN
jgi:NADH-ubiquinone oxidoreductase chain 6